MAKKKTNRKGEIKMTNEEIKNEEIKNDEQVVIEETEQVVSNAGEENVTVENNEETITEVIVDANASVIEDAKPEEVESEETIEEGVVEGCAKLNVRKEASKTAEIVCVINKGDLVVIDRANSTEDFYKVSTSDFEGYCAKAFIKIK